MTDPDDAKGFDAARRLGRLTVQELWLRYLALGGTGDVFDVEAFLQGLGSIPPDQRDVLAHAVNERLKEVYDNARVRYLDPALEPPEQYEDPLDVLSELLDKAGNHRPCEDAESD